MSRSELARQPGSSEETVTSGATMRLQLWKLSRQIWNPSLRERELRSFAWARLKLTLCASQDNTQRKVQHWVATPKLRLFLGGTVIRGRVFFIGCMVCGLCVTGARADAVACKAFAESLIKTSTTPYHSISLINAAEAAAGTDASHPKIISQTSETISTGTAIFVRFGSGSWQKIQAPLDALHALARQNAESFSDCQHLDDQKRDGQSFAVYTGHRMTKQSVAAMQIWIAKDRGLPIESQTDVVEMSGAHGAGSRHVSTHYAYDKIVAPVTTPDIKAGPAN